VTDLDSHGSILLLPAAGPASQKNLLTTVAQPVDPGVIADVFKGDPAGQEVFDLLGTDPLAVWGFRDNNKLRPEQQAPIVWDRIGVGTLALFSDTTHYHTTARVIGKGRAPWVSDKLWEDPGFPWIVFLTDVREVEIDIAAVKQAAGYADNYNINRQAIVPKAEREVDLWELIDPRIGTQVLPSRVWWVNQGVTWKAESAAGYLFAPERTKAGIELVYWKAMTLLRVGDRIVHYANGSIRAVSTVAAESMVADRPSELWDGESEQGYYVPADYVAVEPPVLLAAIPSEQRRAAPRDGPFDVNGRVKEGYLFPVSDALARDIAAADPRLADLLRSSEARTAEAKTTLRAALTFDWLVEQTHWRKEQLEELVEALTGESPQVVLAGPPGTSKTWVAKHVVRYLTQDAPNRSRIIQFHPTYGYEEFIEGLRPVADRGAINFQRVDGIVLTYVREIAGESEPCFLLIDEMNRANLARVFGELMYLFEYRDEPVDLRYTKGWRLPWKLKFIGTMNTADRSIRSIDVALRRRFDVFDCPPDASILERFYSTAANDVPGLVAGFNELNVQLADSLDRHHTIGHAFFMSERMTADRLLAVWNRKIGPLLEEYFFDQPDLATAFTLDRFWPSVGDAH
jgi:MoxR-like ATPase